MESEPQITAACLSNTGLVRSNNEDVCAVDRKNRFFLVADGIGGAAGGEIASRIFLDTATRLFQDNTPQTKVEMRNLIETCFNQANREIREYAQHNPEYRGMGCTAELLAFWKNHYILGHVGDSRTYRLSHNELQLLTIDHSLAQEQVKLGVLSEEQAQKSGFKHILSRAVGTDHTIKVDILEGDLIQDTLFLLCTDGLYNMLSETQITPVLQYDAPLSFKAEMLIDMANDAGGLDNITVTLVAAPSAH